MKSLEPYTCEPSAVQGRTRKATDPLERDPWLGVLQDSPIRTAWRFKLDHSETGPMSRLRIGLDRGRRGLLGVHRLGANDDLLETTPRERKFDSAHRCR
jgi:hypothetical protein